MHISSPIPPFFITVPPVNDQPVTRPVVEVACDESGFSGTNMLDPDSRVFSHATVELDPQTAAEIVEVARRSVPYAGDEFKANHLLRQRQRPTLAWLLGPDGPIHDKARVHLVDKTFFVAERMVDVLITEPTYAAGTSLDPAGRATAFALHQEGPRVFGADRWHDVLMAFTTLMRAKYHSQVEPLTDELYRVLRTKDTGHSTAIVDEVLAGRARIEPYLSQVLDERSTLPPLEPLIPAIVETALAWGTKGQSVSIIHDEQSSLTPHRMAQVELVLAKVWPTRTGPLLSVSQVDSRVDPRVQVADLLAGAARRIATNELRNDGERDAELAELLNPYIDPSSIWSDHASWCRLTEPRNRQALPAASW